MSLGNSSTRSSSTTNNTTSDERIGAEGEAIVIRGSGSVTDGGAIEMAGDVSRDSLDTARRLSEGVLDYAGDATGEQLDAATDLARLNSDVLMDAAGFVRDGFNESIGIAGDTVAASNAALGTALEASRPESARLAQQLVMIGLPVAAVIFLARALA